MIKSPKQQAFSRLWTNLRQRTMQRDQKNLKISVETHHLLKIFAAQRGLNISDCADKIIELSVTSHDLSRELLDGELMKLLRTE